METRDNEDGKSKRGWVIYALIASLAVNILVAGLLGGALLRDTASGRVRIDRNISALGLRVYFRALDPIDRAALRATLKADRKQFHAGRAAFRAHLRALSRALTAEPYDPEKVVAALRRQANNLSTSVAFGQRVLLERIAAMPPDVRKAFGARLLAPHKGLARNGSPPLKRRN